MMTSVYFIAWVTEQKATHNKILYRMHSSLNTTSRIHRMMQWQLIPTKQVDDVIITISNTYFVQNQLPKLASVIFAKAIIQQFINYCCKKITLVLLIAHFLINLHVAIAIPYWQVTFLNERFYTNKCVCLNIYHFSPLIIVCSFRYDEIWWLTISTDTFIIYHLE